MAKRVMNELHLKRIAAVDRPCQEGALAQIFKRAPDGIYLAKAEGDPVLATEAEAYLKLAPDEAAKRAGTCLPDGSFPITARGDFRKALAVIHRAPDFAKARAHLTVKARAMDATSQLPADWQISKLELLGDVTNDVALDGFDAPIEKFVGEMDAVDFDSNGVEAITREYANALLCEVDKAVSSLRECAAEIDADPAIAKRDEALQESVAQFKAHIVGIIPEGVQNALVAKALEEAGFEITEGQALTKRETDMGASIELKKSLGLPVTANDADVAAAVAKQAAKAEFADNLLKMSAPHLAYMAKGQNLGDGGKEGFAALSVEKRDEIIKAFPPELSDEDKKKAKEKADMEKAAADLAKKADEVINVDGNEIRKSVVGDAQFAIYKSLNDKLEKAADERAVSVIEKRASTDLTHIGKAAELATLLHSVAKANPKAAEQIEAVLKAADAKIAKGGLLNEVGKSTTGQNAGTAAAQIEALATEKVSKGEAKNIYKARDMVRKANPELEKQEAEERKKVA